MRAAAFDLIQPQVVATAGAPAFWRDLPNASLEMREDAAGVVPEGAKVPSGSAEHSAVLLPKQERRAVKKDRVAQHADVSRPVREREAHQAERQRLVIQVRCFIAKDAHADRAEQARARGVAKRLVEGDGEHFRRGQHHGADLQAGQLAQAAKDAIDPVLLEPRNPLAVEETSEDAAVALLLGDEEIQRGQKPRVGGERRVRCGPAPETAAARPFAQLELPDGGANETELRGAESQGVVPGEGAQTGAVLGKMAVPPLIE